MSARMRASDRRREALDGMARVYLEQAEEDARRGTQLTLVEALVEVRALRQHIARLESALAEANLRIARAKRFGLQPTEVGPDRGELFRRVSR